jgi:hypothetical protein
MDREEEDVVIENVAVVANGLTLIVEVDGWRYGVPQHLIRPGSEVRKPGDRGRLVIPRRLAVDLGFVAV